ncbi:MAG: hypothetical protein H7Z19_07065 [Chitinophagaceae bacterium]|nr:hypothetical protein [Rubrivivax sp.]
MKRSPDASHVVAARDMMERQVGQMVRLIDDLLDVSRISSCKIELRKERHDLRAIVDAALETSRPVVDAAQHGLTVQLPDHPVARRRPDPAGPGRRQPNQQRRPLHA